MNQFFKSSWCQKLIILVLTTGYFIVLIFVSNSAYVWATLVFVFVLFITSFSCTTNESPILVQLRGNRNNNPADTNATENGQEDERGNRIQDLTIWMTDVPPSYSIVMAGEGVPQTPPPTYGSAILLFPPPYPAAGEPKDSEGQSEGAKVRRPPLSISTQVSMVGNSSEPPTPQTPGSVFTFSSHISLSRDPPDNLSLRTQVFLARAEEGQERDVYTDTLQLRTNLFLSRQASRDDSLDIQEVDEGPVRTIQLHSIDIPLHYSNTGPQQPSVESPELEPEHKTVVTKAQVE